MAAGDEGLQQQDPAVQAGGGVAAGEPPRGAMEEEPPLNGPARYGLGPYHQRLARRRRADPDLQHEVEEALFLDTWVDADAVRVEVRGGVVTLSGSLPDHHEVRFATDDAWDVDGVRGVISRLEVDQRRAKPLDQAGRPGR
jgi:hypothetical protein